MISQNPDWIPGPDEGNEKVWGEEICSILSKIVEDAKEVEFYDDEDKLFYVVKRPFPGANQYLIQNKLKDVSYGITIENEMPFFVRGYQVDTVEAEYDVKIMSGLYRKFVEDSGKASPNESVESTNDGKWGMKITGELEDILKGRNEADFSSLEGEVLFNVRNAGVGSGFFTIHNKKTNIAYCVNDDGEISVPFIKKTEIGEKVVRKEEVEKDVEMIKNLVMKYPGK